MNIIKLTSLTALLCFPAYAATQGTLDTTSQGSVQVSIAIPERVNISGLSDFNFGQYTGSGDLQADADICIYSNTPTAGYSIRFRGSGASHAMQVDDGSGNTIAYTTNFNPTIGIVGNAQAIPNTNYTHTGANTQAVDCSIGGNSGNIQINMLEANLQAAPNGNYTGTLTILVEPN